MLSFAHSYCTQAKFMQESVASPKFMNKCDSSQCFNSREMLLTQIYMGRLAELPTSVGIYGLIVHLRKNPQQIKNQGFFSLFIYF